MLAAIAVANLASLWCPSVTVSFGPKLGHQTSKVVILDHLGDLHFFKNGRVSEDVTLTTCVFGQPKNDVGEASLLKFKVCSKGRESDP